jgi:hypothetical protein
MLINFPRFLSEVILDEQSPGYYQRAGYFSRKLQNTEAGENPEGYDEINQNQA